MILRRVYDWLEAKEKGLGLFVLAVAVVGIGAGIGAGIWAVDGALALALAFALVIAGVGVVAGAVVGAVAAVGIWAGIGAGIGFIYILPLTLSNPIPVALIILTIAEALFWLDESKVARNQSRFAFTALKKAGALFDALLLAGLGGFALLLRDSFPALVEWMGLSSPYLWSLLGWVGVVSGVALLLIAYVWVNSLRYRGTKGGESEEGKS